MTDDLTGKLYRDPYAGGDVGNRVVRLDGPGAAAKLMEGGGLTSKVTKKQEGENGHNPAVFFLVEWLEMNGVIADYGDVVQALSRRFKVYQDEDGDDVVAGFFPGMDAVLKRLNIETNAPADA